MHGRRLSERQATGASAVPSTKPRADRAQVPCIWRSLIDVYCVCSKRPQITSRPDPKSGARSGKGNRFFDQINICSSWCECRRPIRKVRGKPPTRLAVYHTSAEVCGEQLHGCAVPIHLMLDSAPCVLPVGHMPLCVPFFGHIPSSQIVGMRLLQSS